jgi:hypothetical protein
MRSQKSEQSGNGAYPETVSKIGDERAPSPASVFDDLDVAEARDTIATASTRRVLTRLSVKRPEKQWFFRTHPEFSFQCWLYEDRDERETYYVWPQMADELTGFARIVLLRLAITRQGTVFLFPVKLPQDGSARMWNETARDAAEQAQNHWVAMRSNLQEGCYEIYRAEGVWPEPEWPELSKPEILKNGLWRSRDYVSRSSGRSKTAWPSIA